MKWSIILVFFAIVANGQQLVNTEIDLVPGKYNARQLLEDIASQYQLQLSYNPSLIKNREVSITENLKLQSLIIKIFGENSRFKLKNDRLVIYQSNVINGFIRDKETGETLIGASVAVILNGKLTGGVITNKYGFYALELPQVYTEIQIAYMGYMPVTYGANDNVPDNIELVPESIKLQEIVVTDSLEKIALIETDKIGHLSISTKVLKDAPALFGESDIIKMVQLQPGVVSNGEGSTNFYVRGGQSDQNLVMLDESPVFNPSHLLGFFSVFNADAIVQTDLYKSGIPAIYGGRLSSVLDVRMKEGNNQKLAGAGGIGILATRLLVEGPLKKDKSSFVVTARRTYADLFFKLSKDEFTRKTSIYFYDITSKLNFKLNPKNRVYFSGYFGRDFANIKTLQYGMDWGIITLTSRWNHIYSNKLFSNLTAIYSRYDYQLDLSGSGGLANWRSSLNNYGLKADFSYYHTDNVFIKFGGNISYLPYKPGFGDDPALAVPKKNTLESALYVENEHKLSDKSLLTYGLRYSLFQLVGPATTFESSSSNNQVIEVEQGGGTYTNYHGPEPRVRYRYKLNALSSIKASYDRTRQYKQILTNLNLGFNVFDIWIPSTRNISPQIADQYSVGYYKTTRNKAFDFSTALYYKSMRNQIALADHSRLLMNKYMETEVRQGRGQAYGLEITLNKNTGKLTGQLSYTWSRTKIKVPELNDGKYYPTSFDQPHHVALFANYHLSKRIRLGANFNYATGRPTMYPVESFTYDGRTVPVYQKRNAQRLPDYHRLDLSVEIKNKNFDRRWQSSWTIALYNVYNRYNASGIFLSEELNDLGDFSQSDNRAYHKLYLFGIVPSITYHFRF